MSRCACAPLIFFVDKFDKVNPSTKNISEMTFCSSSVGNVYVGRLFSYWTSGSANMSSDCKIDDADSNSIHASPAAAACKETCGRERLIGCTCAGIVRLWNRPRTWSADCECRKGRWLGLSLWKQLWGPNHHLQWTGTAGLQKHLVSWFMCRNFQPASNI